MKNRLHIYADDLKVNFRAGWGGANFFVNATHKPLDSFLYFTIKGWKHYNYFPMSKCTKSSDNKYINEKKEPDYIMSVTTPDASKGYSIYNVTVHS